MYGGLFFLKMTGARHRKCATAITVCLFLFVIGVAGAVGSETRQHSAHQHGLGKLNIGLDGNKLIIELTSPAANIVGFEHAPEDEQQSHEVHEAIELLKEGENLFALTKKAQCSLHEAHVESDMDLGDHKEHDTHHQEHKDTYPEKDHAEGSVHSEFEGTYHFECKNPSSLKDIDVLLFSRFPGFEELEVQILTPKGQTAVELTPKRFQVSF